MMGLRPVGVLSPAESTRSKMLVNPGEAGFTTRCAGPSNHFQRTDDTLQTPRRRGVRRRDNELYNTQRGRPIDRPEPVFPANVR